MVSESAAHVMAWEDPRVDDEVGEDCEAVFDIACCAIATTTRFVDGQTRHLCDDCAAAFDDDDEGAEPDADEGEWDV